MTCSLTCPLIAEVDGVAAGLAVGKIWPASPTDANVYQMWVAPPFRGAGVARALLDHIVQWARDQGAHAVLLGATCGDTPAQRLYRRVGFAPVGDPSPLRPDSPLLGQGMRLPLR